MNRQGKISHIHSLPHASDIFTVTIPEFKRPSTAFFNFSLSQENKERLTVLIGLLAWEASKEMPIFIWLHDEIHASVPAVATDVEGGSNGDASVLFWEQVQK
jgi:hypothetical protein